MGNKNQNKKYLSLISLNYSGILLSPFQFFSKQSKELSDIEIDLSNNYKSLLKQYSLLFNENKKENKFKWSLGKIDQKMQKQRYSPLYNKDAGLQKNNQKQTLMSQQAFSKKWNSIFDQNIQSFQKKDPNFKFTPQQRKEALQFDLLCYKTILCHIYPEQLKSHDFQKVAALNPGPYRKLMEYMFSKSFLNEQKKLAKTFKSLEQNKQDIFFVQEANQNLIKGLKNHKDYHLIDNHKGQSIVILRKECFPNFETDKQKDLFKTNAEAQKMRNTLLWNDDSQILAVRFNGQDIVLVSGHLSSKKEKNPEQVFTMIKNLVEFQKTFKCKIIVGCDVNSFAPKTFSEYVKNLAQKQKDEKIGEQYAKMLQIVNIYPTDKDMYTTSKERTYLQPQVNKAEQVAQVCRDHLLILGQNIKIQNKIVRTIDGKSTKEAATLPCQSHPFDHYVVKADLFFEE